MKAKTSIPAFPLTLPYHRTIAGAVRVGLIYVPGSVDRKTCAALAAIVRGKGK